MPVCLVGTALVLSGCAGGGHEAGSTSEPEPLLDSQVHEEQLAGIAAMYGLIDVPEVQVRRIIEPAEWQTVLAACMAEQGFEKDADGSWPGIPVEQKDTFNAALYVCHASYPVPTVYSQPWSEPQKRAMYQYTVSTLIPCLEEEGFRITDVPTQETFVDTFDTRPWWPYEQLDISSMSQNEIDELNTRCPQTPPIELLQDQ